MICALCSEQYQKYLPGPLAGISQTEAKMHSKELCQQHIGLFSCLVWAVNSPKIVAGIILDEQIREFNSKIKHPTYIGIDELFGKYSKKTG